MNKAELKIRLAKAHRHFAWRIMVYLKAHPEVLSENNNQEIFDAVREIQIQYRLRATPKYTREDAAEFVDFMCELEAKHEGAEYYVEQEEMDLYRPGEEHTEEWRAIFFITLILYDDDDYKKEVCELTLDAEETERQKSKNLNTEDSKTQ